MLFKQGSNQRHERRNRIIRGEDLKTETTLSLEEAYYGTTRLIQLNGQTIKVTIKPGVADRQILRIAGKGQRGLNGGTSGNLYLSVRIAPDPEFHRDGNNLELDLPVELYTAVLGGKIRIKTLKGKVTVNIPKETSNGNELRLRGLGMPIFGKKMEFGDLFLKTFVKIPHNLNEQEIDLFTKLAALRN
jgi:curved DNA-binding protein